MQNNSQSPPLPNWMAVDSLFMSTELGPIKNPSASHPQSSRPWRRLASARREPGGAETVAGEEKMSSARLCGAVSADSAPILGMGAAWCSVCSGRDLLPMYRQAETYTPTSNARYLWSTSAQFPSFSAGLSIWKLLEGSTMWTEALCSQDTF